MITFDGGDLSYEYNTLCFWKTTDGRIFSASDSGCSYPIPFENYEGSTLDEVLCQLERVGSADQALSIFDSWNNSIGVDANRASMSERNELSDWVGCLK